MIGKHVIVRSDKAGVFFGVLSDKNGTELILTNVRKIYYWSGANTVEDLALQGVKNPNNCKITNFVEQIILSSFDQILPCSEKAIANLKQVFIWKA